jgi:hypothetical protein
MSLTFQLDDSISDDLLTWPAAGIDPPLSPRGLLNADWENSASETLMLYVAEEPRIGDEFAYHDLRWRIVDYRDGWVAQLMVGE